MSPNGIPAAIIFMLSIIFLLGAMIGYDFYVRYYYGTTATITFGIRYLIEHVPLLMMTLSLLFGMVVGGLLVHFAGSPDLWWNNPKP